MAIIETIPIDAAVDKLANHRYEDLLARAEFVAVIKLEGGLVLRDYIKEEVEPGYRNLNIPISRLNDAIYNHVIAQYVLSETGDLAPASHGIITSPQALSVATREPTVTEIADMVDAASWHDLDSNTLHNLIDRFERVEGKLNRMGIVPEDTFLEYEGNGHIVTNNVLYDAKTDRLKLIDFSRWRFVDGPEFYQEVLKAFAPRIYEVFKDAPK